MSRNNKVLGDFFESAVTIGDVINITTWMPRRAKLHNYVVVGKPSGIGYEGLIIRKVKGFGGTAATMHIPWQTLTSLDVVGYEEVKE